MAATGIRLQIICRAFNKILFIEILPAVAAHIHPAAAGFEGSSDL
ncbi:MAG: hypothetical protein ABIJ12_10735 [bacterium]